MAQLADDIELRPFTHAPWPLRRDRGADGRAFFDVRVGARRGHTTRDGEVRWEDSAYSDNRALLAWSRDFDPLRAPALVVFLHGNRALLERDVLRRQRVPAQVRAAGVNAALIAPQLACDAPDSSAGRFAQRGVFRDFLDEACAALAARCAATPGARRAAHRALGASAVILVAYSGGYCPAAAALAVGAVRRRVRGLVLLDALYAEAEHFAAWFAARRRQAFLVSAYTRSTRAGNLALRAALRRHAVQATLGLKAALGPGDACLVPLARGVRHDEVVTHAWVVDPLTDLLRRCAG